MAPPPVQYVKTSDGYDIAYCVSGEGFPLVFIPPSFSNVRLVWRFYGDWLDGLAARFRLIQFDSRGEGMSTRGLPPDVSMSDFIRDVEAVVGRLGLDSFLIWGWGLRSHIAVRYAAAHPESVRALILHTSAATNSAWKSNILKAADENWDFVIRSLVSLNALGKTHEEHQRMHQEFLECVTPQDFRSAHSALLASDIGPEASRLQTPTLLLNQREHFMLQPEESMRLAAMMPDARFALLETHDMFGDSEQGLAVIDNFVAEVLPHESRHVTKADDLNLSARQLEVLRLIAAGKTNRDIAAELFLSERTVERHVADVYDRIGVTNRAQAAVYAQQHGLV